MKRLLIVILIVLTIIACQDDNTAIHLDNCLDCELVATDTPATPINVIVEE